MFAYKLELERTFRFKLFLQLGKEFWSVSEPGICSPKSTPPLLILEKKVNHPYGLPALSPMAMGLKYFSSAVWEEVNCSKLPHVLLHAPFPSRLTGTLGAEGGRKRLSASILSWLSGRDIPYPPTLVPAASVAYETTSLQSGDAVVKCLMCALVYSSVK